MPRRTEINIFNIGSTKSDNTQIRAWLDHIGANEFELPEGLTDAETLISMAAKRCYMSFIPGLNPNVERVRTDYLAYLDNILASGHGSVLEHVDYLFAIEGVSRVFTGEMNRHRAGWAISEGSMRFIQFREMPYWLPTSFVVRPDDSPELTRKKIASQYILRKAFRQAEENYAELARIWDLPEGHHDFAYKKIVTSAMRRVVPMGIATGGIWKGNIRGLRHVMTLRGDPSAEEEIFHVFHRIGLFMIGQEPKLFGDFDPETMQPKYRKV